jgi:hypothetical protein
MYFVIDITAFQNSERQFEIIREMSLLHLSSEQRDMWLATFPTLDEALQFVEEQRRK